MFETEYGVKTVNLMVSYYTLSTKWRKRKEKDSAHTAN